MRSRDFPGTLDAQIVQLGLLLGDFDLLGKWRGGLRDWMIAVFIPVLII